MSSAYGKIDRSSSYDATKLALLLPMETTTKYNRLVSIHSFASLVEQTTDKVRLMSYLQDLLNQEIQFGNTYPQKYTLDINEFKNYFLSADAFIVINGGTNQTNVLLNHLEENILGTFYIKPNFPGRCSHVCFNRC
jgi:hypothetical protein